MASNYFSFIFFLLVQYWSVIPGDAAHSSAACKGYAVYNLTFIGMWNKNDHPTDFPEGNAHFSPIIGASHDSHYKMWAPGIKASNGIKTVAETGDPMPLYQEIKNMTGKKYALMAIQGPKMPLSTPGNLTGIQVKVNYRYHFVSIVSMIAPSPDWFVGIHDQDFCDANSGMWMESPTYNLLLWDSGTDDGVTFKSIDKKTDPPVNIFQIKKDTPNTPFNGANPIPTLAVMKFTKVSEGSMMTTQMPTEAKKMTAVSKASGLTLTHVTFILAFIVCSMA